MNLLKVFKSSVHKKITLWSRIIFCANKSDNYSYYRPQRSWTKVMFLQASVILSTGGCLPQCMLGCHPPLEQTHHPRSRHPPGAYTPREHTPPPEQTPPQEADSGIRSTSARYSSYWNAFLFFSIFWCPLCSNRQQAMTMSGKISADGKSFLRFISSN